MNVITVNDLIRSLKDLKKEGYGDCKILLPTDDECNSYRKMYVLPESVDKILERNKDDDFVSFYEKELNEYTEGENCRNYIILG